MIRNLVFRQRRLERSFAISTALLVFVLMGTTMGLVHRRVAASLRRGLEARGSSVARSIGAVVTPSLLAYNYAALDLAAKSTSRDEGLVYVVIHDKEGALAGYSGSERDAPPELLSLPSTSGRPARFDVEVPGEGGSTQTALEVAVPVQVQGSDEPWGTVRVGMSYAPVRAELRQIDLLLLVLGAVLASVAVASGRWMARRITAPLRDLAEGTEALAHGDMSRRIPATGAREIADLARAFNLMMDRLQEKAAESEEFQRALERLNATLEEQVHERTRALEESEAQYKSLVDNSPDSILILQRGRIRFVNEVFVETFGVRDEGQASGDLDLARIFDPSSATLARSRIAAWERGEDQGPIEVLGRDNSGEIRHLELRGSPIEYRGAPAVECLLIDNTEAKRLQDQLSESDKLRALGELAGGVAHDFNNLLSAILGRVQLLRREKFGKDHDRELEVIEKAAQDGRETVRRIQEFSRVRKDRTLTPVDLAEVLRDSAEITRTVWKTEAQRRNVNVQISIDAEEPSLVMGSASELREVFTNLILNAVDAMPQGGKLALSCRRRGGRMLATVRDSGVGMTEEIRRSLFDPFFTTKGPSGTGLGLSVVYGIVTRHEGSIEVETALGRGTTFHIEFPAAPEGTRLRGSDGAAMPQLVRPGKILVIDDETDIAELLRDVLAAEGHTVKTVMNGSDGVKMARLSPYDVVFTDLGMPDLSGWEVARRIRDTSPRVPIVLVTGWGASLDPAEVREAGIDAVVHKPFEIEELLEVTARVLRDAAGETGMDSS